MTVLATGGAGRASRCLSRRLMERGTAVLGFDNVNPYHDFLRPAQQQLAAPAGPAGVPGYTDPPRKILKLQPG